MLSMLIQLVSKRQVGCVLAGAFGGALGGALLLGLVGQFGGRGEAAYYGGWEGAALLGAVLGSLAGTAGGARGSERPALERLTAPTRKKHLLGEKRLLNDSGRRRQLRRAPVSNKAAAELSRPPRIAHLWH